VSLGEFRSSREASEITREEYWDLLSGLLVGVENLGIDLAGEALELQVSPFGMILKYRISSEGITVRFNLSPLDKRSAPFVIVADGSYEPFQAHLLFELGKVSSTFLDIGSNIGFYTNSIAILNQAISIHAFEPNPDVYTSLLSNLDLNGLGEARIVAHNIGVSDCSVDDALFFVPKYTGTGGGSLKDLHPEEGDAAQKSVSLRRLDEVDIDSAVDLIKIDVEGAELAALTGATNLIVRDHPTIVAELLRKWMKPFDSKPQDVIELLIPLGYRCFAIEESAITRVDSIDSDTEETNFVFVHEDKMDHMSVLEDFIK
jgi:FkbM family methyltransferase